MLACSSQLQVASVGLIVYTPPVMNQPCELFFMEGDDPQPPYSTPYCQVRGISKFTDTPASGNDETHTVVVIICLPMWTPVYGSATDSQITWIRVLNNERDVLYRVVAVWDVAQGFSNEYRVAQCQRMSKLPGQ